VAELQKLGFEVTIFYYNPNIWPVEEYQARLMELKKYLAALPAVKIIEGDYENTKWLEAVRGLEKELERGKRCDICYKLRLERTARLAAELKYEYFGSSLSISPHKKAEKISQQGQTLAKKYGLEFLDRDWKKLGGFQAACQIAKERNFYRQNYCGCAFSVRTQKTNNKIQE